MTDVDLGVEGIEGAEEIGRGGFGVVYRATETELGRTVAVKLLLGDFDERARIRFDRERLAMGSLSGHPNIVTVYRSGFTATGRPYLLMEYLGGGTIADWLERDVRLPWVDVTRMGIDVARALGTAHRAGVLHRDVKPGNILIGPTGAAKLGDFGIARLHGAPETKSAVITASVAHAPPEVIGGSRPDEQADIYSLASTLFEMAWGSPAFARPSDESLVPMLSRIVMEPPPDLRAVGVPEPVADAIVAAMSKDKAHRFATADAFADGLERALTELTAAAPAADAAAPTAPNSTTVVAAPGLAIGSGALAGHASGPGQSPPPAIVDSPSNRSRWVIAGMAIAVTALLAVGLVLARSGGGQTTSLSQSVQGAEGATTDNETTTTTEEGDPDTSLTITPAESVAGEQPTQTPTQRAAPVTDPPPAATRTLSNSSGAISVVVPASWGQQTSDASSLLVTPDLQAALADEWVKGALLQAVRNTPEQNPGGFAPDLTLDQLIIESECVVRERGPYADSSFVGSYAVLDQCGNSGLSTYFLVAAPSDLSMVVLVAVSFESPEEDEVVQLLLDSLRWDLAGLP